MSFRLSGIFWLWTAVAFTAVQGGKALSPVDVVKVFSAIIMQMYRADSVRSPIIMD